MKNLMVCTPHPVMFGDHIEKKEMDRACSTYGGGERRIQGSGGQT